MILFLTCRRKVSIECPLAVLAEVEVSLQSPQDRLPSGHTGHSTKSGLIVDSASMIEYYHKYKLFLYK